ncbi:MAG: PstS family phosphate ABC transporter substrate-binding protein [Clostridia bacterium]|nr:PstS family phosphate ABC transporter substrate-binding protein [Clostridia bacterium]
MRTQNDASEPDSNPVYCKVLPYLVTFGVVLLCGAFSLKFYFNRPEVRYAGHGFDYMNGYSSTDFTDYTVYSEHSKLVTLDHKPDFVIENENDMPVMDGAEACYPLYAAVAKAVYRDIDTIESNARETDAQYTNGKIVSFTNTVKGFSRLLDGEIDLLFGARPSKDQLASAESEGIALTVTPIGREGFVFFVEEDNPVDNITSDQVRAIYHGEITNWKEVGGKDQKIKAFQRPQNSGSQSMMEYFMGDISLREPDTYEIIGGMLDVIQRVAQYANEDGALGYSFRYFIEGLNQEKGVKLLSIDGVAPTLENIENGSYPLTVALCLITRTDDSKPNVQRMIDFMLSEDGQELVRKTGYAGLRQKN